MIPNNDLTMIRRFTVIPKAMDACNCEGFSGPKVPREPMQPMNRSMAVPTTSASTITSVPFWITHNPPEK